MSVQLVPNSGSPVTSSNFSIDPPSKYVVIDGVRQFNPAYKAYQAQQHKPVTTALNPEKALPVVTNMNDHEALRQASLTAGRGDVPLAESTDATIDMMQDPDICRSVGLAPDAMVDALGAFFAKHEIPMGLMNKLMGLTEYNRLEFIVDDSGSMGTRPEQLPGGPKKASRWEEAHERIKTLIELMAYVPTPPIKICFLNRTEVILLQRAGETPEKFIQGAYTQIDRVFKIPPAGTTPVLQRLEQSLKNSSEKVARYLFCDGVPNGGKGAIEAISSLLLNRPNPEGNPFTFLSCSENDEDIEWMKDVEEVAPYCAESDDFISEAQEVRKDQGDIFPYTRGFYLVSQLVGVMNPDDLDAMDESAPFTKFTLDNLLGVKCSEQEYRCYFDGFKEAQSRRAVESPLDQIKKQQNWESFFHDFMTVRVAKNIPAVKEFKARLEQSLVASFTPQSTHNWSRV